MNSNQNITEQNYEILPDDYVNYDLSFKLIIIGDSGTQLTLVLNSKLIH